MTVKRTTQLAVEVVGQVTPTARATQIAVEVVGQVTPTARVSQLAVEVIATNVPDDVGNANKYRQIIVAC